MIPNQFQLAVFIPIGELEGTTQISIANLSPKWLKNTSDFLLNQGPVFSMVSWGQQLSHIQTSLASSNTTAMVTFYVRENIALSMLLQCGPPNEMEIDAARQFVESLRNTTIVKRATWTSRPFQEMLTLTTRPLAAVVVWPNPKVSDEDHAMVRELSTHLTASFFLLNIK
jgi:hypothetical protein